MITRAWSTLHLGIDHIWKPPAQPAPEDVQARCASC